MTAWLFVPLGIMLILLACFGVNCLIGLSNVSFPASVACMILLFFGLIGCEILVGDRRTRAVVQIVDIPVSKVFRSIRHHVFIGDRLALRYVI